MGSHEQDLAAYQGEIDRAEGEVMLSEHVAGEIRHEINQSVDDLETLLYEATESGDFPFRLLGKILTTQHQPSDANDLISKLRECIAPGIEKLVADRLRARIQKHKDDATRDKAEAQYEAQRDSAFDWLAP